LYLSTVSFFFSKKTGLDGRDKDVSGVLLVGESMSDCDRYVSDPLLLDLFSLGLKKKDHNMHENTGNKLGRGPVANATEFFAGPLTFCQKIPIWLIETF